MKELEKENADLKSIAEFQQSSNMQRYFEIQELKKENAKLKKELKDANEKVVKLACNQNKDLKDKLTKAKEIINDLVHLGEFNEYTDEEYFNYQVHEALKNSEQFLKEIEK